MAKDTGREHVVEIQRARVLAAMVVLAAERGVSAVTVGDVVSHAGVSRRTFYELFDDRDACFLAAFEHGVHEIAGVVVPAYEAKARWRERTRAGLAALLEFLDEEPALGALCVVGALNGGEEVLKHRAQVLRVVQQAVDEGRAEAARGREPPPLTAEGIVGAVFGVVHTRLAEGLGHKRLIDLLSPLMGMVVLPYLGAAAAGRELARRDPPPRAARGPDGSAGLRLGDPLVGLKMRLTYRTLRVLAAVAADPGASNRQVADGAGITDQGQVSKLLARLESLKLVRNNGEGSTRGAPNAWTLTSRGRQVEQALRPSDLPTNHAV